MLNILKIQSFFKKIFNIKFFHYLKSKGETNNLIKLYYNFLIK